MGHTHDYALDKHGRVAERHIETCEPERTRVAWHKRKLHTFHGINKHCVSKIKLIEIRRNLRQRTHKPVLQHSYIILIHINFTHHIFIEQLCALAVKHLVESGGAKPCHILLFTLRSASVMDTRSLFSQCHIKNWLTRHLGGVDILLYECEFLVDSSLGRIIEMIVIDGKCDSLIFVIIIMFATPWVSEILPGPYLLHEFDRRIILL